MYFTIELNNKGVVLVVKDIRWWLQQLDTCPHPPAILQIPVEHESTLNQ
jgi:hypothetical protein